jgi:hypothetical protein
MKNLTSLALTALTTHLLVGCVTGDNEAPADDDDAVSERVAWPNSCAEKAKGNPNLSDGEYKLYLGSDEQHQWSAYCVDLQSDSPKEYVTLHSDQTYSRYAAGGKSPGADVVTTFDKIRVDPITLKVDLADLTFATSEGSVMHMGTTEITSMGLGIAMSCDINARAFAQIDLRDTPFGIVDRFKLIQTGDGHSGMWESGQVIELGASPDFLDCGWIVPSPVGYDAPLNLSSNWGFALTYL